MRSYRQYCALAKALDVVGDRWNLLIVRELMLRDACRYVDLQNGLPGIATNLLADRLRDLEAAGVIKREDAPPPVATTLFALTERGRALKPLMVELARWGIPLMHERAAQDAFRGHWVAVVAQLYPTDRDPQAPPVTIELRVDDERTALEIADGTVRARPGGAAQADLVLEGPAELILAVIVGGRDVEEARRQGLHYEGDVEVLRRLRPAPEPAQAGAAPAP